MNPCWIVFALNVTVPSPLSTGSFHTLTVWAKNFGGEGGMRPGFGNFGEDMETTDVDLADAHISVEIDGGKASGSMDDIQAGTFVTITMNGKGEVTNVLVSSMSGFGSGRPARGNN